MRGSAGPARPESRPASALPVRAHPLHLVEDEKVRLLQGPVPHGRVDGDGLRATVSPPDLAAPSMPGTSRTSFWRRSRSPGPKGASAAETKPPSRVALAPA